MSSVIMICSLFLDGLINYYFSNSILSSLFTVISLIYISNYLDNKKFYIISFLYGFIYDIFYNNFFILNSIIFLLLSYIIKLYFNKFKYNFISAFMLTILVIIIYITLLILIFNMTSYAEITLSEYLFIIPRFMIMNILYGIILNLIVIKQNKKHKLY